MGRLIVTLSTPATYDLPGWALTAKKHRGLNLKLLQDVESFVDGGGRLSLELEPVDVFRNGLAVILVRHGRGLLGRLLLLLLLLQLLLGLLNLGPGDLRRRDKLLRLKGLMDR